MFGMTNEKALLIITLVLHIILMVMTLAAIIDLKTPRYIKSKSFLKMGDVETPLSNSWSAEPLTIKHSYIDDVYTFYKQHPNFNVQEVFLR